MGAYAKIVSDIGQIRRPVHAASTHFIVQPDIVNIHAHFLSINTNRISALVSVQGEKLLTLLYEPALLNSLDSRIWETGWVSVLCSGRIRLNSHWSPSQSVCSPNTMSDNTSADEEQ